MKNEIAQDSKEFPKFLYHKTEGAKLFQTAEEVKEAGKGWEDTPAKFSEVEEISKLPESELVEMNKDSGLKESTLKRRTKKELAQMIVEKK